MVNDDILNRVHNRVMDSIIARGSQEKRAGMSQRVAQSDEQLRRAVEEFFLAIEEMRNPELAVELLAEHAAILIEMIKQFKRV